jgi:hypothetical protein
VNKGTAAVSDGGGGALSTSEGAPDIFGGMLLSPSDGREDGESGHYQRGRCDFELEGVPVCLLQVPSLVCMCALSKQV